MGQLWQMPSWVKPQGSRKHIAASFGGSPEVGVDGVGLLSTFNPWKSPQPSGTPQLPNNLNTLQGLSFIFGHPAFACVFGVVCFVCSLV